MKGEKLIPLAMQIDLGTIHILRKHLKGGGGQKLFLLLILSTKNNTTRGGGGGVG